MTEPQTPSAERTQLDKLGAYIFENVPGAPLRAYGIAEQAIEVIAAQRRAITDLAIAIQHTVEYVGYDTLHARPGWSWYDALTRHAPELLDSMRGSQLGERVHLHGESPLPRVSLPDVASGQEPGSVTAAGGWCAPTQAELHGEPEIRVGPHEFDRLSWRHRNKCRACYLPRDLHPIETWVWARPIGDTSPIRKGREHL
jgi:hypothetical protein